ncbi:hypothetical protein [Streptomyces sp. NPDC091027]|uniref:hypothetical protein n=1 Tax=Streptomyces sp. NPDC091027 TaxID=3365971 RepID=UPI00381D5D15
MSGSAQAEIIRLERTRFAPGDLGKALAAWSKLAHTPRKRSPAVRTGCGEPSCCPPEPDEWRELLEIAMHALPSKSARELARIVGPLDSRILDHPALRHNVSPRGRWWHFSRWPWED